MMLFKKIRKKLLISRKIKNYFVYALGEILLIVIGILIAWKINNLNEIKNNRILELKIYESLNEELNSNLILLDSSITRYKENVKVIKNTMSYMGLQYQELTDDVKEGIISVDYKITKLHNVSINSVNSTNKFEFIESGLLKELIAAYPSELDNFENQETKIQNIVINRLQPLIEAHISLIEILSGRYSKHNKIQTLSKQSNYDKLLNNREFQNTLIDRLLQTEVQLAIAKSLKDKTKTIAINLVRELEN
ncbi:hypothetical protein JBL43_04040 [Aureibaculum sp. A20]|uniref:Uncharacterized protein n=1 Tax=Aureibaculum flavum TaxID=2795986 RepID=A0ABS0WN54_9FLAO|nr:hypothetical protein [Aureibaculum flavum]MBJ2173391.1 hypothetical protein [Aureibaculum flavum]